MCSFDLFIYEWVSSGYVLSLMGQFSTLEKENEKLKGNQPPKPFYAKKKEKNRLLIKQRAFKNH